MRPFSDKLSAWRVLGELFPNGWGSMVGNDYDAITWDAPEAAPSFEEIEALIALPVVPQTVTPLQARSAIRAAGLKPQVDAALAGAGEEAQERWDYALEIRRDDALLAQLAVAIGLTDADLDALFIAAAAL